VDRLERSIEKLRHPVPGSQITGARPIRQPARRREVEGRRYNPDMVRDTASVIEDALALPDEIRASLAGALLNSLDPESEEGVDSAWLNEIQRRAAELNSGAVTAAPWTEVDAKLRAVLASGR
jgi:putative addiction module component (TIGR02574 family)